MSLSLLRESLSIKRDRSTSNLASIFLRFLFCFIYNGQGGSETRHACYCCYKLKQRLNSSVVIVLSMFDFNKDSDNDREREGGGGGSGPMFWMSVRVISALHFLDWPSGMFSNISSRIHTCGFFVDVSSSLAAGVSAMARSIFHSGFDNFRERVQR